MFTHVLQRYFYAMMGVAKQIKENKHPHPLFILWIMLLSIKAKNAKWRDLSNKISILLFFPPLAELNRIECYGDQQISIA